MSSKITIVNCTPHVVNLIDTSNLYYNNESRHFLGRKGISRIIASYEPSGIIPRCSQKEKVVNNIKINNYVIDVYNMEFGQVEGLPEEKNDTFYIVSSMVAKSCPKRHDLLIPAHMVHDTNGDGIIGCTAFAVS